MLEVTDLHKTYGDTVAVDGISFVAEPGVVTGFLGPNGAGKTTTMRIILGLDRPTSGHVFVNGQNYVHSSAPICELGALLEAKAADKGRSARNHLRAVGRTVGIKDGRVDEVLDLVGLTEVKNKPVGGFSLGMGQRLGIGVALLADPQTIMLDEPVNGLDPDGIAWMRTLLKDLAEQGRTVFVSSHLMSEMAQTAQHLIIVGRGKVLADTTMETFIKSASGNTVYVQTPQAEKLATIITGEGGTVSEQKTESFTATGLDGAHIGQLASQHSIVLHQLTDVQASLEDAFMELTADSVQFSGRGQL